MPTTRSRVREFRLVAALVAAAAMSLGCGSTMTVSPSPSTPATGRSTCPGAVQRVESNLQGSAADAVESLGSTYGSEPGVRAVVYDGTKAVLIVDAETLPGWQTRLIGSGVAVASSCIDPGLLDGIQAVLPEFSKSGVISSAGYDGLEDAIVVAGVDPERLVSALERYRPGLGEAARAAIAEGTLRVGARGFSPG